MLTNFRKLFIVFISAIIFTSVYASEKPAATPFKIDCRFTQSRFDGKDVTINISDMAHAQHIFILQNISRDRVILDHKTKGKESMGAGWSSNLDKDHWSAFAVNKPDFDFICQNKSYEKTVCQKVLKICVLTNFEFDNKQTGSYWYVENKLYPELQNAISKRLNKA